ncbi:hypothetical protein J3326_02095 [Leuconostoc mesenteroides]|uniref:hypothetical protein n=1 Tax=Leuconostoc mesenteroides TaxID=1245 RepID=UPI001CBD4326|nr:hypothetical protein [Leuconostoc mesenteroides]MBZ1515978.1 hypothetical protein [Leuconostoc mesenteroides]
MTFDEALEHFRNNTDISGTAVFLDDVEDTLKELSEEYAPTVEMTKKQYEILASSRNNAVNRVDKVGLLEFMSAYALLDLEIDHLKLMQAWLHPETIKVVDE